MDWVRSGILLPVFIEHEDFPAPSPIAMNDFVARSLGALRIVGVGLTLSIAAAGTVGAQGDQGDPRSVPVVIPRLEGPIRLDGRLTEEAWAALAPFPMIQHLPVFGAAPTEFTEVRVAHSDTHIYVGAVMRMKDMRLMRPGSYERDRLGLGNDWIGVTFDSQNDKENSLLFATSPLGNRTDVWFANDGEGDRPLNPDWNAFWETAVTQDEDGWYAEFRIPFSTLRFQPDANGNVRMGMTLWRWVAAKQEAHIYPAIQPNWQWAHYKASQAQLVEFHGLERRRRPVYAVPYVLGGGSARTQLAGGSYETVTDRKSEIGLDMKIGLRNHYTLDLTANTDFAQVEVDDQQLNLTRFSLFFPEKRLFFQEQRSAFEFGTGGVDRVFYSRRIGLREGEQVPIHGGARLAGQSGPWEIGALNMYTAPTEGTSGEAYGVLRVRRRLLNPYSHVGGIVTHRANSEAGDNVVLGLDGRVRFGTDLFVSATVAQSADHARDGSPSAGGDIASSVGRFHVERRGFDGLRFEVSATHVGADYAPAVGFVERRGHLRFGDRVSFGFRPQGASRVFRYTGEVRGDTYLNNESGRTESMEINPSFRVQMRRGHTLTVGGFHRRELVDRPFVLFGELPVPLGGYDFNSVAITAALPSGGNRRLSSTVEVGEFYDGRIALARVSPAWDVSPQLELSGQYEANHVTLPPLPTEARGTVTAHILRVRARVFLDTRWSVSTLAQYNSAQRIVGANVRLRYNLREGDNFFIAWTENMNTELEREPMRLPRLSTRTIIIKYARTFAL